MANTYTLIASNTLSSSAASVTFSAIPNTFADLVLKTSTRSTVSGANLGAIRIWFNGDSSTLIHSHTELQGNGAAAGSGRESNKGTFRFNFDSNESAGNTSNTFQSTEYYLPNYANTSYNKQASLFTASENNSTTAYIDVAAHLWRSTSAVTSLTINDPFNFASGSSFFLYGIKNS